MSVKLNPPNSQSLLCRPTCMVVPELRFCGRGRGAEAAGPNESERNESVLARLTPSTGDATGLAPGAAGATWLLVRERRMRSRNLGWLAGAGSATVEARRIDGRGSIEVGDETAEESALDAEEQRLAVLMNEGAIGSRDVG